MNNEDNPTNQSELAQQEILLILEKLKERYQLDQEESYYQLATTLYKIGIRHNMFSKENFQGKIFLDEIVKYLAESIPPQDIKTKDIKTYEIKRHPTYPTSTTIAEPNINSPRNPNIVNITDHQTKRKNKKKRS